MKYARYDFYTIDEAVTYGIRPSFSLDEQAQETWEVYVKLTSGTRVVYASGGTAAQAGRALLKLIKRIESVDKYLLSTLDNCFVDPMRVVRVYVDGQGEGYVGLVEDTLGEAYRIAIGTQQDCRRVCIQTMRAIATLQAVEQEGSQVE